MAAMEEQYGSLTRALLAKQRQARREGRKSSGPAGPGGTLTTFRQGMYQLPQAIASCLGERLRLNAAVKALRPIEQGFEVVGDGFSLSAEKVLLCLPAAGTAELLEPLAPRAVEPLKGIVCAPIAVVMSSYPETAFPVPMQGFGFLAPGRENLGILGSLYCHSIFPGQAPPGTVFLRTMIGGARDPAAAQLDDRSLEQRIGGALKLVLGRAPDPERQWIVRHPHGISQYTRGHLDRVRMAEEAAREVDIELAGSPFRGVSVNDCITQARAAARRIVNGAGS
jgi:oxygen-dependent protoporphyrinogen oxidase